jgi:pimeloyl-ACP methyl ester carboxylesterase
MSRPLPVLFIHGLNGDPGDWTDSGFRQYLLAQGDLDPALVRLFRYGVAEDGTYNNRGDLRPIAARLAGAGLDQTELLTSSVERLSQDSVAKGGPAQVTLIAHSLGGIISRYYLSCRTPDEFGTAYRGNIGRLITIGSPHRGVDLLRLTRLAPRGSLGWHFIRSLERMGLAPALPASAVEQWEATLEREQAAARARFVSAPGATGPQERVLLTDTPIYQQLAPDSSLLAALNTSGTMPPGVECHCFYGDIRVAVQVRAGRLALVDETVSFGDFAVPTHSAREIPGASSTPHPYVTEQRIELTLRGAPPSETRSLNPALPDTAHANLLSNGAVHDATLRLLNE